MDKSDVLIPGFATLNYIICIFPLRRQPKNKTSNPFDEKLNLPFFHNEFTHKWDSGEAIRPSFSSLFEDDEESVAKTTTLSL